MDNNELLLAISTMLDTKLDAKLGHVVRDIQNLKSDMQIMKSDMKDMKSGMLDLKSDILDMKSDIQHLESDIRHLESDIQNVKLRVQRIEVDLLENNIIPRLNIIDTCNASNLYNYKDSVKDHETMKQDIDIIKKAVTGHSEKLQKIS